MATPAVKIDSNVTGLSYAKESNVLGVLPGSPVWNPLEPNTYGDFGGQITTVARNPINPGRQNKKGVVTDLEASGGFIQDITQTNLQELMEGLFFAALRRKVETGKGAVGAVTSVNSTQYLGASGYTAFRVGDLVKGNNFTNSGNNQMKKVTAVASGSITVGGLTSEASPPSNSYVSQVGFEFASDDAQIVTSFGYPRLVTTIKDCTQFGLIPGEFMFIGGDAAANQFATAADNGFVRVRSVTATYIEFDKTAATMVADNGSGKTIRIFFGRVIKNELGTNIVRTSYQLERTLGAPDLDNPTQIQSQYVVGALINEGVLDVPLANKATFDFKFMGTDSEVRTGATGVKSGTRNSLVQSDAFNTSSDVTKIKMAQVVVGDANPSALFSYVESIKFNFNNHVSPNKAVGRLGAFDMTAGTFEVGGDTNAYFADVAAISAVRNNADVTLEMHLVKSNAGISIDLPLITLSDGRPKVEQDKAIMVPLTILAASGAKVDPNKDYTALMCFYDYLPSLADT